MQRSAICCNAAQPVATPRNVLHRSAAQRVATQRNVLQRSAADLRCSRPSAAAPLCPSQLNPGRVLTPATQRAHRPLHSCLAVSATGVCAAQRGVGTAHPYRRASAFWGLRSSSNHTGLGSYRPAPAPQRLRPVRPRLHRDRVHPRPHLLRDWAHPTHICTRTEWAHPAHSCIPA